jgi:CheY-like chemotaxis protein
VRIARKRHASNGVFTVVAICVSMRSVYTRCASLITMRWSGPVNFGIGAAYSLRNGIATGGGTLRGHGANAACEIGEIDVRPDHNRRARITTASQRIRVAVVTPPAQLDLLDTILAAGDYDVMVIESADDAYAVIKENRPHLVVMCVDINETDGCNVLSMLALDLETSRIPIITYLGSFDRPRLDLNMKEPDRLDPRRSQFLSLN